MPNQSHRSAGVLSRRRFLRALTVGSVGGLWTGRAAPLWAQSLVSMPFANGQRSLVQFPQKRPLILLTMRPPQTRDALRRFR